MENSDVVFALNRKMQSNICEHINISKDRVRLIDNGVNTDIYIPLKDAEKEKIKSEHNLSGKTIILQVGSVNENKGQERSVRMLAPLLRNNTDVVFAYAGGIVSEEYHQQVIATAKDLGVGEQVVYLGSVSPGEQMNRLYNMATATVFVSRYEGFCLVCIESLSAGVPVVVCEKLQFDLGHGCTVAGDDDFLSAVSDIISDDTTVLSSLARENALNNYTWSKISQDYYNNFLDFSTDN